MFNKPSQTRSCVRRNVGFRSKLITHTIMCVSHRAEGAHLLHFSQVRQKLFDAALELWESGQGFRGLQFSREVQPTLEHFREKENETKYQKYSLPLVIFYGKSKQHVSG